MSTTLSTITVHAHNHAAWDSFGLDALLMPEEMEFRNERESGYGEWFAIPDDVATGPDGTRYRVVFEGTHGNDHSPGASHYTFATLYPIDSADAMAEFDRESKRLDSLPEYDPDAEDFADDDSENPYGWNSVDTDTD